MKLSAFRTPIVRSIAGLADLLRRGIDRVASRLRCRAAAWELGQLDDRSLRDIGLSRSEVHAAAYGLLTLSDAVVEASAGEVNLTSERPPPSERLRFGPSAAQ